MFYFFRINFEKTNNILRFLENREIKLFCFVTIKMVFCTKLIEHRIDTIAI